jgi:hypothetical protein
MSEDLEDKAGEPVELTEEQIAEREAAMEAQKKELKKFYQKELPLLRLQAEYEECLAKIDVAKMQRFEIMMAKAQMMNPADQEEPQGPMPSRTGEHMKPAREPEAPKSETGERKLKKTEDAV